MILCVFCREPNRFSEVCSNMEENQEAIGEGGHTVIVGWSRYDHLTTCHLLMVHWLASADDGLIELILE